MGEGAPPEFDLPRKHVLEEPGRVLVIQEQVWDCNWLQQIENSLDAVHVSFVHIWGKSTRFDQGITTSVPELEYSETEAGIRQVATRSKDNVRVSDWTFPNNNHVVAPGMSKGDPWSDISVWAVPIDDQRTMRYTVHSFHASTAASARELGEGPDRNYDPADHYEELFDQHRASDVHDMQFISAQDYVAVRGQGTIVDRESENLSSSDAGIMLIRKIFWREMEAIRLGQPTKRWYRLQHRFDLPVPAAEAAY
jgi:5,5'-dehydrodivanillate O-demethylase oxygenase subunit